MTNIDAMTVPQLLAYISRNKLSVLSTSALMGMRKPQLREIAKRGAA